MSEEEKAIAAEGATIKLKTAWKMGLGIIAALWSIAAGWYGNQAQLQRLIDGQTQITAHETEAHDWLEHISQKQDSLEEEVTEHEQQLTRIQNSLDLAKQQSTKAEARDKKFEESQQN